MRTRWFPRYVLFSLLVVMGALGLTVPHQSTGQENVPAAGSAGPDGAGNAAVLALKGPVSPASADYIVRGIEKAAERNATLIVLQMDTPGGLDTSMRDIIRAILSSPVPVATWVGPSGSRAASAGTYILYASHIAAMAPGTNLGAATPVAIGGTNPFGGGGEDKTGPREDSPTENSGPKDADPGRGDRTPPVPEDASKSKAINDAVAFIRGLAEMRGRNVEWAEKAVREAASLSANAAANDNVVDFVANSISELLEKADGRVVRVADQDVRLETRGIAVERIQPDWRTRILGVVTNPNIALIFMMIGIYGLIFEFINPGALVPGTIGAISLIIGLYSLAILPISFAGIALMVLGVALIIGEAFAPSFGILGIGGTISLVLGATVLVDTDAPSMQISWPVIGAVGVASLGFSLLVARMAYTAHRQRVVSGREEMIGLAAKVVDWNGSQGHVFVHGERWRAISDAELAAGQTVTVTGIRGLTLQVEPDAGAGADRTDT